jgi:fatty-acyl-CoA synthase
LDTSTDEWRRRLDAATELTPHREVGPMDTYMMIFTSGTSGNPKAGQVSHYVGKPLAYVLATPEKPDDADNSLRVAFGNEASDRDIDDFGRRFGVEVWDGFGSTENAVIITREPGTPKGSIGKGFDTVAIYHSDTVQECAVALFDKDGALTNPDDAIGELVNTAGKGFFTGYYNDDAANEERTRHGMYWSGDLGYRDADG